MDEYKGRTKRESVFSCTNMLRITLLKLHFKVTCAAGTLGGNTSSDAMVIGAVVPFTCNRNTDLCVKLCDAVAIAKMASGINDVGKAVNGVMECSSQKPKSMAGSTDSFRRINAANRTGISP